MKWKTEGEGAERGGSTIATTSSIANTAEMDEMDENESLGRERKEWGQGFKMAELDELVEMVEMENGGGGGEGFHVNYFNRIRVHRVYGLRGVVETFVVITARNMMSLVRIPKEDEKGPSRKRSQGSLHDPGPILTLRLSLWTSWTALGILPFVRSNPKS